VHQVGFITQIEVVLPEKIEFDLLLITLMKAIIKRKPKNSLKHNNEKGIKACIKNWIIMMPRI
jgi:hypothetical protein